MDDFFERISVQLQRPLPGVASQRTMEPELAYGRHRGPSRPDARPAAVVVLLYPIETAWHVPMMLRPDSLTHHGGQISLPGGQMEPGESSEEAALRELEEELGIPRFGVLLLGQLSPLYLFGSNFLISPCVAGCRVAATFKPSDTEVADVLQVPLGHLLNPANRGYHIERRGDVELEAPHFDWRGSYIWGATSMILAELVDVVRAAGI